LAVDRAAELGEALGAEVHIVMAYSMSSSGENMAIRGRVAVSDVAATGRSHAVSERIVARARERLEGQGLTVHTHVQSGDPAQELVTVAEKTHAQLIVVGNRGMSGLGRILGSVPNLVSHRATCGVLIVPTTGPSDAAATKLSGKPIVVGTDGSSTAQLAVREATRMAAALGSELQVASGYKAVRGARIVGAPEGAAKVWAPLPDSFVEGVLQHDAAIATRQGVSVTKHALEGDPAKGLLDLAQRSGAGMIAIGSKGMQGARRLTLGNVSHQISHKATCDVHIVFTGERADDAAAPAESTGGSEPAAGAASAG
jgi:nucleotide-binding universal stress UspA family protein